VKRSDIWWDYEEASRLSVGGGKTLENPSNFELIPEPIEDGRRRERWRELEATRCPYSSSGYHEWEYVIFCWPDEEFGSRQKICKRCNLDVAIVRLRRRRA
jgi:hypothetical protein